MGALGEHAPSPKKKLLLHVGPAKTGTTGLQMLLDQNREVLKRLRISYPGSSSDQHRAARALLNRPNPRGGKQSLEHWNDLVKKVSKSKDDLVISSEFFSFANSQQIESIVKAFHGAELHILITARSYYDVIPGVWQQQFKYDDSIKLEEWIRHSVLGNAEGANSFYESQNYVHLIKKWAAHVSTNQISLFVLPSSQASIAEQVEIFLGIAPGTLNVNVSAPNRGLTASEQRLTWEFERQVRDAGISRGIYVKNRRVSPSLIAQSPVHADLKSRLITLPAEFEPAIGQMTNEFIAYLSDSGVNVLGDLGDLRVNTRQARTIEREEGASSGVPIRLIGAVAAEMVTALKLGRLDDKGEREHLPGVSFANLLKLLINDSFWRLRAYARDWKWHKQANPSGPREVGQTFPDVTLHIGPHKTGTTSLQIALKRSSQVLRNRYGIDYVTDPGRENANIAVQAFRQVRSRSTKGSEIPPYRKWEEALNRLLRSPRSVLSAESFCTFDDAQVRELHSQLQRAKVTIVITLRPLAKVIPSQWQQIAQNGPSPTFEEFIESVLAGSPLTASMDTRMRVLERLDHSAIIRRWTAVFGSENVKIVIADEQKPEHLFNSLADTLEVEQTDIAKLNNSNRSLTLQEIETIRSIYSHLEKTDLLPLFDEQGYAARITLNLKSNRKPSSDEPRVRLKHSQQVIFAKRSNEIQATIKELGVKVYGDPSSLTAVGSEEPVQTPIDYVPAEIGAAALLSLLRSVGLGASITSGSSQGRSNISTKLVLRAIKQRVFRRVGLR